MYKKAGAHVGAETEEFWDRHWRRTVATRLQELTQTEMGKHVLYMVFMPDEWGREDGQGRAYRDKGRESRDTRG